MRGTKIEDTPGTACDAVVYILPSETSYFITAPEVTFVLRKKPGGLMVSVKTAEEERNHKASIDDKQQKQENQQ